MGNFQPPKQITIPNSVTGNVLPDRVATESNKMEKAEGGKTISYLNAKTTQPPRGYVSRAGKEKSGQMAAVKMSIGGGAPAGRRVSPLNSVGSGQSPRNSPRQSVSSTQSITPEPRVSGRGEGREGWRERDEGKGDGGRRDSERGRGEGGMGRRKKGGGGLAEIDCRKRDRGFKRSMKIN